MAKGAYRLGQCKSKKTISCLQAVAECFLVQSPIDWLDEIQQIHIERPCPVQSAIDPLVIEQADRLRPVTFRGAPFTIHQRLEPALETALVVVVGIIAVVLRESTAVERQFPPLQIEFEMRQPFACEFVIADHQIGTTAGEWSKRLKGFRGIELTMIIVGKNISHPFYIHIDGHLFDAQPCKQRIGIKVGVWIDAATEQRQFSRQQSGKTLFLQSRRSEGPLVPG